MTACVFCGATDNLTTSMNVKTTKGESVVHVCAEHEDNASPKKVRELVESRESALAEMEEKCRALGFTLTPIGQAASPIAIVKAPEPAPVPVSKVLSEMKPAAAESSLLTGHTDPSKRGDKTFKVRDIDTPATAVDKTGAKVNLGKESSYDTTQNVATKDGSVYRPPKTLSAEMQVVEGRAGVPIAIPKTINSEAGRTDFKVLPTAGSSDAMKKRFEEMAAKSMGGNSPDFRHEYDVKEPRQCNFCGGTGKAKIGDQVCPRCKGAGELA